MTSPHNVRGNEPAAPSARGLLPNSDALAALLTAAGASPSSPMGDVGFHQGTVLAWDSVNGTNTILVLGAPIEDVPVLTTGDNVLLSVGNLVGVLRFKTTYFVLGRITSPGASNAFAWTFGESVATGDVTTVFPTFGDPTVAAPVVDFVVGTSRRALLFYSVDLQLDPLSAVWVQIVIGGTSSMSFSERVMINNSTDTDYNTTMCSFVMLQDGFNGTLAPGPSTATLKYALASAGDVVQTTSQRILMIPF